MSKTLKKTKVDMSKEEVEKAHSAIASRNIQAILGSLEAGFLQLSLDDLYDSYKDLKNSASAERVDFRAVEALLKELRDIA